ncbi:DUF2950 domain-containing protein [Ramlibacter monticola]|uniref:DUF2950 domain-containing protein n=1 Tax=Ramlibacter monticola TaxID=1926872 RepID=A0A937CSM3_9BURK|nr:DUF2950 domain-containing protein [Ramlibacter monticola]MBL0391366.1 DUF2950 domain-containing protein [Ramlibacter monticola]
MRSTLALAAALLFPLAALAQQTTYPTPEAAVDALQRALQADDEAALGGMFGEKYRNVITSGDAAYDKARRADAAAALATRKRLEELGADKRIVRMGVQDWPFAIPLVREGVGWRFATEQGAEELQNRRVGANERNAIYVMRAIVDAQRRYAEVDRAGDGVLQYAKKLGSSPGKHDGLYWSADAGGDEPSPLGPLVAKASTELAGRHEGEPYGGYRFRILTRQGANAPGGAYSYVINNRMIAGFAAVATPAEWGRTGVMSFLISHNGKLYEKNLGPKPPVISSFDPGPGWKEVPAGQ